MLYVIVNLFVNCSFIAVEVRTTMTGSRMSTTTARHLPGQGVVFLFPAVEFPAILSVASNLELKG